MVQQDVSLFSEYLFAGYFFHLIVWELVPNTIDLLGFGWLHFDVAQIMATWDSITFMYNYSIQLVTIWLYNFILCLVISCPQHQAFYINEFLKFYDFADFVYPVVLKSLQADYEYLRRVDDVKLFYSYQTCTLLTTVVVLPISQSFRFEHSMEYFAVGFCHRWIKQSSIILYTWNRHTSIPGQRLLLKLRLFQRDRIMISKIHRPALLIATQTNNVAGQIAAEYLLDRT